MIYRACHAPPSLCHAHLLLFHAVNPAGGPLPSTTLVLYHQLIMFCPAGLGSRGAAHAVPSITHALYHQLICSAPQDLAVVVLLMLIPLLAPSPDGSQSGGLAKIAQALGECVSVCVFVFVCVCVHACAA